tara:strand:+ start:696 stop:860 length:165 start_codon:yes stop_codon:yes gene_type:complete
LKIIIMTREDLITTKKIAYTVVKEQPVWISDLIGKDKDDLKRLEKILKKDARTP